MRQLFAYTVIAGVLTLGASVGATAAPLTRDAGITDQGVTQKIGDDHRHRKYGHGYGHRHGHHRHSHERRYYTSPGVTIRLGDRHRHGHHRGHHHDRRW